jgi:cephalosporin hydroxylase
VEPAGAKSLALTERSFHTVRVNRRFWALLACGLLASAPACRRALPKDPVSEIHVAGDRNRDRIVRGIFPGTEGWRWTAPAFAFALDPPASSAPVFLELDFTVPEELQPPVTVAARVNGIEVGRRTYPAQGRTLFACPVPAAALTHRPAAVEFTVDKTYTDPATAQVEGVIVISAALHEYEQTAEFRDSEMAKSRQAYERVIAERDVKLPRDKQNEIMRIFHDLPIWESLWFQNVRIIKNPLDLWMLQQIAYEVRPDFIVETGTWFGGSALWWAHTLNGIGIENARVLTVDIQDLTKQGASSNPLWKKYVEFSLGSSTDPRIVTKFAQRTKNSRVIVNLDSDHSMHHVLNELRAYAPMVSPGSYIAVEDTHLDGVPTHPEQGPGPMAAVRQFLAEPAGRAFEQDFTREAMVMTSYPGGWLRRKR